MNFIYGNLSRYPSRILKRIENYFYIPSWWRFYIIPRLEYSLLPWRLYSIIPLLKYSLKKKKIHIYIYIYYNVIKIKKDTRLISSKKFLKKATKIVDKNQTKQHLEVKYQIKKHVASQNHWKISWKFHLGRQPPCSTPRKFTTVSTARSKGKVQKDAINLHGANIILCRVSRHSQE